MISNWQISIGYEDNQIMTGLYRLAAPEAVKHADYANVAIVKMTIAEPHHKLGHVAHSD